MELEKRYSSNPKKDILIYIKILYIKQLYQNWANALLLFFKLWGTGSPKAAL